MNEELIKKTVQKEIINGIKKELDSALIFTYIHSLEQENNQLKEQRQELRSWLENEIIDSKAVSSQYYWFGRVLSKLNELEGGNSE